MYFLLFSSSMKPNLTNLKLKQENSIPYLLNLPSFVANNSSGSTFIIEDYANMANYPQMSLMTYCVNIFFIWIKRFSNAFFFFFFFFFFLFFFYCEY